MSGLARRSVAVLLLASGGPTLAACSAEEASEPGVAASPSEFSTPTEEPTEKLGGPTLDQEGVQMTLPEGFLPDSEGLNSQQTSINPDGLYAGISTVATVSMPSREEQVQTLLDNTEVQRPGTMEDDVELDGATFLHLSGRFTALSGFRIDLYRAATPELLIGIRVTTPQAWSDERREAFLQPILDSVVVP